MEKITGTAAAYSGKSFLINKEVSMPTITPFRGIRPAASYAERIAALPYDVYNRKEALAEVTREPLSFLAIDRAETMLPAETDTYDAIVYDKARELLTSRIAEGYFIQDDVPCYYLYELTMDGRSQTGLVCCSSIDDYINGIIKKHENTREEKELDRIRHVDTTGMHTGPIFLAYRAVKAIDELVSSIKKETPVYDFTSPDGIRHRVFKIDDAVRIQSLTEQFAALPCSYIADGHHRCASAVKVGLKRRKEQPGYTGDEEFNRFLSVLFPDDQLVILPYNRVVRDLNGLSEGAFLQAVADAGFTVTPAGKDGVSPSQKGTFGMYLGEKWYLLTADATLRSDDPIRGLDVSILQDHLLSPILGIGDPRTDDRIDFVGGIRGIRELEKRVHTDMQVAFSMFPTSMSELFAVADAGMLMPPKSTWFEPKLRSGLFLHSL